MRLWLRGTTPITVECAGSRSARPRARLRLVDGRREVVLALASRRAIYELAVRLAWLWAQTRESEPDAGKPRFS